jgi:tetratricopeptide (TPR) repeat protein
VHVEAVLRRRRELARAVERGERIDPGDDPVGLVLSGIDRARRGELASAAAAVDRALAGDPPDAARIAAAVVLYSCRRYGHALAILDAIEGPRLPDALAFAIALCGRLEWTHELDARLRRAHALEPSNARHALELVRLHRKGRDDEEALEWADRALALVPHASAEMERANTLLALGRPGEVSPAVDRAVAADPDAFALRLEAARLALAVGDFASARAHYAHARRTHPERPEPARGLALVALREGDLVLARSLAGPGEDFIAAAADVVEGRWEEACAALDALRDPGAEALAWRAEAAMRLGRNEESHRVLDRAMAAAEGFFWVGWTLRLLTVLYGRPGARLTPAPLAEVRSAIASLLPGESFPEEGPALAAFLERALARVGANRSVDLLHERHGRFVRVEGLRGPRWDSRRLLESIRVRAPERAVALIDDVIARYPESSLPICHRGELKLWIGDLAGARADLEATIEKNPFTRWAYIGLTTIETLEGRPDRALEVCEHGVRTMASTGPAVHVARGEALLALGRVEEARADLERAVSLHPSRLAAVLLLALLEGEHGRAESFETAWPLLVERAPGLVSDAAHELGVSLARDPGEPPPPAADRARVLRRAIALMRGNRSSSCISYFAGGALRFVTHFPHRGDLPHARDETDLGRALRLAARG